MITTAVTRPPKTCMRTVAHAQKPKLRKISLNEWISEVGEKKTGMRAGNSEKRDNWTLRTQRSACDPLRTISK